MAKTKPKKAKSKALKVVEPKLKVGDPYHTITDKVFGEFTIKYSANAWWMDSTKVELLINAFKYRATNIQACIGAGISGRQLEYFVDLHPEFCDIMELCRQVPGLKAKQTMVKLLDTDGATVRWFLEATESGEYGKKPPVVAVQINMAERMAEKRKQYE